jgi:hypothetical protein
MNERRELNGPWSGTLKGHRQRQRSSQTLRIVVEDEIVVSLPEIPQDLGDPSVPGVTSSVRRPQRARGDPKV